MPRAMNPDGSPWWVSTGPPARPAAAPSQSTAGDSANSSHSSDQPNAATEGSTDWSEWLDPSTVAATMRAGVGLLTGFLAVVSQTAAADESPAEPHDVSACGICPVCVAVAALKEHDPTLGSWVESALAGVTSGAERVAEFVPNAKDAITEQLVAAVTKALLARFHL